MPAMPELANQVARKVDKFIHLSRNEFFPIIPSSCLPPAFLLPHRLPVLCSLCLCSLCCAALDVVDVVDVVGPSGIRGAMAGQGEALMAGG